MTEAFTFIGIWAFRIIFVIAVVVLVWAIFSGAMEDREDGE